MGSAESPEERPRVDAVVDDGALQARQGRRSGPIEKPSSWLGNGLEERLPPGSIAHRRDLMPRTPDVQSGAFWAHSALGMSH
jgi:hypothetical protein